MAANVLSGFVLMAYLHRASRNEGPFWLAALKGHPLLARGLITGLVGAVAVAVWFFVLDVVTGHPLRTPAALGSALLLGASNVVRSHSTSGLWRLTPSCTSPRLPLPASCSWRLRSRSSALPPCCCSWPWRGSCWRRLW